MLARWLVPHGILSEIPLVVICVTPPEQIDTPRKHHASIPLSTAHPTLDFDHQYHQNPYDDVANFQGYLCL